MNFKIFEYLENYYFKVTHDILIGNKYKEFLLMKVINIIIVRIILYNILINLCVF